VVSNTLSYVILERVWDLRLESGIRVHGYASHACYTGAGQQGALGHYFGAGQVASIIMGAL
jgi:hypothetical protein